MSQPEDIIRFNEDYRRYYDRCVLFAKSYTCDLQQARALASEALTVFWDKTSNCGETVDQPLPYLFSIIRNKALHLLRERYNREKLMSGVTSEYLSEMQFRIETLEECDPHALYSSDVQDIISKSLRSMGGKSSKVFELSRYQGLSNARIAAEMGISVKAVEYHMTKALKVLRIALKDYLGAISIFLGLGI